MTVILLLEIFTKTYTDIHKHWTYLFQFSFVHSFTVRPILLYLYLIFIAVMGCVRQLVIEENDDDDGDDNVLKITEDAAIPQSYNSLSPTQTKWTTVTYTDLSGTR